MNITQLHKIAGRLVACSAVLLLAAGLGGCAVYDDGYGPSYAGGGGYYPGGYGYGGTTVVYGGGYHGSYRPDYDRRENRHVDYQHDRVGRGGWNGGHHESHGENRGDYRNDGRHNQYRPAYGGN